MNVKQLDVLNGPEVTAEHLGHMDEPHCDLIIGKGPNRLPASLTQRDRERERDIKTGRQARHKKRERGREMEREREKQRETKNLLKTLLFTVELIK